MSPIQPVIPPMEKQVQQQNIQEAFLNNARKEKIYLTIYLMSGVKLSGRIKSFDKYSVILEANNQEQLIFKHAISTVVVSRTMAHSGMQNSVGQAVGVGSGAGSGMGGGSHPAPGAPPAPIEAGER